MEGREGGRDGGKKDDGGWTGHLSSISSCVPEGGREGGREGGCGLQRVSHFPFFLHVVYDRRAAVLEDGVDRGDRLPPAPAWTPSDGGYEREWRGEGGKEGGSGLVSHTFT